MVKELKILQKKYYHNLIFVLLVDKCISVESKKAAALGFLK